MKVNAFMKQMMLIYLLRLFNRNKTPNKKWKIEKDNLKIKIKNMIMMKMKMNIKIGFVEMKGNNKKNIFTEEEIINLTYIKDYTNSKDLWAKIVGNILTNKNKKLSNFNCQAQKIRTIN